MSEVLEASWGKPLFAPNIFCCPQDDGTLVLLSSNAMTMNFLSCAAPHLVSVKGQ